MKRLSQAQAGRLAAAIRKDQRGRFLALWAAALGFGLGAQWMGRQGNVFGVFLELSAVIQTIHVMALCLKEEEQPQ